MKNFFIDFFQVTNPGLVRDNNEDSILVDKVNNIAILADGVGGHESGEIASSETVNYLKKVLNETINALGNTDNINWELLHNFLEEGIIQCHKKIQELASKNPENKGMGTTLVFLIFIEDHIFYGHVGDSRLYRYKNKKLIQLTKDHSLYQQMKDEGQRYTEEEINNVPKNIITQAIGITDTVKPELVHEILSDQEIFLLCSDGLSDMVSDAEIKKIISSEQDINIVGENLLEAALSAGGRDNVSIILAKSEVGKKKNNWGRFFKR